MLDATRLRVLVAVARTGSMTAAARELHYTQPSVSHHLARLEAETGAALVQRVGRGIRLTEAGQLLADRGAEILGRLDAASTELAAHVGLRMGRVRLTAFPSALGTFVPKAASGLVAEHPALELRLTETEPPEAVRMLRAGDVDVAVVFRYDDNRLEEDGIRTRLLLAEPTYLVTTDGGGDLTAYRDAPWIAGCERCRGHLLGMCATAGFQPRISYETDDYVAVQSLVAAGLGVTTLPGLALAASHRPDVRTSSLPDSTRYVLAATYGAPPDPPATAALLDALADAASGWRADQTG
ncbi:MAG TPA: LysR family transcriptional regulator [Actinomycetes bacterium]